MCEKDAREFFRASLTIMLGQRIGQDLDVGDGEIESFRARRRHDVRCIAREEHVFRKAMQQVVRVRTHMPASKGVAAHSLHAPSPCPLPQSERDDNAGRPVRVN